MRPATPEGKRQEPPQEKENTWTDFDTHILDKRVLEYGLSDPAATLNLLNKSKWQDFANPEAAKLALRKLVIDMQTDLLVSRVTYQGNYTDLHCNEVVVRAYGRDHFRKMEHSRNAAACENWKAGETYTLPDALIIKAKCWEFKPTPEGGYCIVRDDGLQLAGIPF
jgi:hypothetical protein